MSREKRPDNQRSRGPQGEMRERIFRYVERRLLQGRPPSVREIRDHVGLRAVQTVQRHLNGLIEDGLLLREGQGRSRSLRLPDLIGGATRLVPILGGVQAGALTTALQEVEGFVSVQRGGDDLFALRVKGWSMVNAAILPGDVLVVRSQPDADDGDVVVALVEDEATVKRLRRVQGRVELHPENPDFSVIVPEGLQLLGKVIEVRRNLERAEYPVRRT